MNNHFIPKLESLNEFIKEMKSYKFKLKTKNLRLNLNSPNKIYNINLDSNYIYKIHKTKKIYKSFSSSDFSIFNSKKKNNNNQKYKYDNILVYKYKKNNNINKSKEIIKVSKDRDKYLIRGLALTNREKYYYKKCVNSNDKNDIKFILSDEKVNTIKKDKAYINTFKKQKNELNICYSLII